MSGGQKGSFYHAFSTPSVTRGGTPGGGVPPQKVIKSDKNTKINTKMFSSKYHLNHDKICSTVKKRDFENFFSHRTISLALFTFSKTSKGLKCSKGPYFFSRLQGSRAPKSCRFFTLLLLFAKYSRYGVLCHLKSVIFIVFPKTGKFSTKTRLFFIYII